MVERYKDPIMQEVVKRSVRAAMAEQGATYKSLSALLAAKGVEQTPSTLRTKVATGIMTTSLYIHILSVLKVHQLDIGSLMSRYEELRSQQN